MKKLLLSIIISLFLCTGVYAGPWISGGSSAGGGTVDVSGTPANHYWTGWTDADTIKGFSITASKPVCSDANGDPAVCAGTEGVWQVANADLATLAAGGSANCLWGEKSDSSGIECKSTINVQIDDSAAQFYNATNTTRKIKADASGITADSKTYTIKPIADVDVTFSPGKTYTDGKWCSYATATGFTCNEDAPAGSGDVTGVGDCTGGACLDGSSDGGTTISLYDGDSNKATIDAPDISGDITITLPGVTGTLAILGANTFTADQTITGNILPEAANTRTIGSATAEWADLYLGDGAVINLGNDQDVTITHVADSGLTLAANSEDLTLAATANTWTVSSSTGVTDIKFQGAAAANAMNLATTGTILGAVKVLNAGATEGSGAHTYSPGAADIYGSMILITDSDSVTTVNLPDYQASADADHVKIGASVCVYNTVAKATIVDVAADDKITTTNGTTNAAGASVTGPATIGAFSCFMLVSASSDVGNWAQLGLNGAWPVTP
jgi:hypothetical protein